MQTDREYRRQGPVAAGHAVVPRSRRWFVALITIVAGLLAHLPPLAAVHDVEAAEAPRAGELVVLPRSSATAASLTQSLPTQYSGDVRVAAVGLVGDVLLVAVPPGREEEYKARLAADPTIAAVSRNYRVRAEADPLIPNDPQLAQQWGLAAVRAPEAWGGGARANGVTVAVIDTGADYGHPDLAAALLPGCNFVDPQATCGPTAASDDNGHGTHVAGTIAATTNNGVGVAGLAWGASILPLKALDVTGSGSWFGIASAIGYATTQPGVRVINMSLGSDPSFPPDAGERAVLQMKIDDARAKGITVVVASGNAGANLDEKPVYPASLNGVITVGAVDQNGARPGWSNYGSAITVAAPGVGILSTGCAYNFAAKACDHIYQTKNGTSMASPHAAALAALLLARAPTLTPNGVATLLRATADDLGTPGTDTSFGAGRINAAAALQGGALTVTTNGPGTVVANPPTGSATPGTTVTLTATPDAGALLIGWTVDGVARGWAKTLRVQIDAPHVVVATFAPRVSFADQPGGATGEALTQLATRRIARGYGDGSFGPSDTLIRAQVAGFLVRSMGWEGERHPPPFSDRGTLDDDLWAAVGILAYHGVARGYDDGTFNPTGELLHLQAISLITRAMVTRGYWTQATVDDRAIYPNIPPSDHRLDLVTFVQNAGAIPDRPANLAWGDWDGPSSRGWFILVLWQALDARFGR